MQIVDRRGRRAFRIALSIEMDQFAHRTLALRSFFRQFPIGDVPDDYYRYVRGDQSVPTQEALFERHAAAGEAALREAWRATLGVTPASDVSSRVTAALKGRRKSDPWVLIGGPPCQAYSLVGRSRMIGGIESRECQPEVSGLALPVNLSRQTPPVRHQDTAMVAGISSFGEELHPGSEGQVLKRSGDLQLNGMLRIGNFQRRRSAVSPRVRLKCDCRRKNADSALHHGSRIHQLAEWPR